MCSDKSAYWGFSWQRAVLLVGVVFSLSGCASFEGKFSKTREADIGIFADQTVAMLSEGTLGVAKDQAIYIREFFDETEAEERDFVQIRDRLHDAFAGLVKYSLRLVAISEGYSTDAEKVAAFADYAESVKDRGQSNLAYLRTLGVDIDLNAASHTELISEVRKQEKLLDALRVVQPLISASGRYIQILLGELDDKTSVIAKKIDGAIDVEYADIIRYQSSLHAEKYALLNGVDLLYQTSIGKDEAYTKLKESGTIHDKALLPTGTPDYQQRVAIAEYLGAQFKRVGFIQSEIQPDWDIYRASHRELNNLHAQASANINRSRILLLVWLRAHEKMASGKVNPAAWFDLSETPSALFQLGKNAIL